MCGTLVIAKPSQQPLHMVVCKMWVWLRRYLNMEATFQGDTGSLRVQNGIRDTFGVPVNLRVLENFLFFFYKRGLPKYRKKKVMEKFFGRLIYESPVAFSHDLAHSLWLLRLATTSLARIRPA